MLPLPIAFLPAFLAVLHQSPAATPRDSVSTRSSATATAIRADETITIDGRDSERVWAQAARYSNFRQFQPRVNAEPSLRTEFRVAYDDRNLYVFVRMFDAHPDSIMRALSRRDVRGPSDQVKVMIDSYNDERSGYEFAVNPAGVPAPSSRSCRWSTRPWSSTTPGW